MMNRTTKVMKDITDENGARMHLNDEGKNICTRQTEVVENPQVTSWTAKRN